MRWKREFKPLKPLPGKFTIETYFEWWSFSYFAKWSYPGSNISISSSRKNWVMREIENYAEKVIDYRRKQGEKF